MQATVKVSDGNVRGFKLMPDSFRSFNSNYTMGLNTDQYSLTTTPCSRGGLHFCFREDVDIWSSLLDRYWVCDVVVPANSKYVVFEQRAIFNCVVQPQKCKAESLWIGPPRRISRQEFPRQLYHVYPEEGIYKKKCINAYVEKATTRPLTSKELRDALDDEVFLYRITNDITFFPTILQEKSSIVEETPSIVEETPCIVEETPCIVEEKPSIVEEKPSILEETPSVPEETTMEESSKETKDDATNQQ